MIENSGVLSVEEQINFAKDLIKKINSERVFLEEADLEFQDVEPNGNNRGLCISVSTVNPVTISREATWSAGTEEGVTEDPGNNAEYENSLIIDAKRSFKTLDCEVSGYRITLQVDDVEEDETSEAEVEVCSLSHEDAGIGSYEYWGFEGYDSQPYVEAEGTITKKYDCNLTLFIE